MFKRTIFVLLVLALVSSFFSSSVYASTFRFGSRGVGVTRIQERLIQVGLLTTRATGFFGTATREGVVKFQRLNNINPTGVVGPATLAALFPNTVNNNTAATPTQALSRGSRGAQVTTIQNRLRELNLLNVASNGIFGPLTQAAVRQFQQNVGLPVTGIVDGATNIALFAVPQTPETPPTPPTTQPSLLEPTVPNPAEQPQTNTPSSPEPSLPIEVLPPAPLVMFHGSPGALAGRTIIIDPGHGGRDPGVVRNGVMEKDLVLDISLRLRRMLEEAGATVIMTRETDVFRSLLFRSALANRHVLQLEIERLRNSGEVTQPNVQPPAATQPENQQTPANQDQTMQDLIARQIELAQIQQRQNDLSTQINIINEMILNLIMLDESKLRLQDATNAANNEAAAAERSQIFQREQIVSDLAARIGLPGNTREVADSSLLSRQTELQETNIRVAELRQQISALQRQLEQNPIQEPLAQPNNPATQEIVSTPVFPVNTVQETINMWQSKITMFDHFINNPTVDTREGIFAFTRDASNNIQANPALAKVFDLTRERYQNNIVFISIHLNSTAQEITASSGVRMFYRHNGPQFAWGSGNPFYYQNYNATLRRSLSQNLLNSLNENTNFQIEVLSPLRMDFSVIRETNLVSSLIEIGFLNNPADRALLILEQFREDATSGIYRGLVNHFNSQN